MDLPHDSLANVIRELTTERRVKNDPDYTGPLRRFDDKFGINQIHLIVDNATKAVKQ